MDKQKQPVLPDENSFNDYDKIMDVLHSLKAISGTYLTFTTEAGSQNLQDTVKNLMNDMLMGQRRIFDFMYTYGWYAVTPDEPQKIQQAYQKCQALQTQVKR